MTAPPARVLFASRAYESPATEGGFLLLKDLADHAAADSAVRASFFSSSRDAGPVNGVQLLPAYSNSGWGLVQAFQFSRSLRRQARKFDVVHTAHVPTLLNTTVLSRIRSSRKATGARFVQTVTALPAVDRLRRGMFWGDAVVCLNEAAAESVRPYHDNVVTIVPLPRQKRLDDRPPMPADVREQFDGHKIVTIAADMARMSPDFDARAVCSALLSQRTDIAIAFACRFGEEKQAHRLLGSLVAEHESRLHIFGTIDWMLDLLAVSDGLVYPIQDLSGKFNPPMVLLEAARLGCRIVTNDSVALESLVAGETVAPLKTDDHREWAEAVIRMIDMGGRADSVVTSFDDVYNRYVALYRRLIEPAH